MSELKIGVGCASLRFRHSQSLKDKRKHIASITQRLRNLGFSVTESNYPDNPKLGELSFVYAGKDASAVTKAFTDSRPCFMGDFEILDLSREVLDYESSYEHSHGELLNEENP